MDKLITQVPAMGVLLSVGLPLAGMALAGFIVFIELHFKQRRIDKVLETVRHLADRGQPVPANLLDLTDDSLLDPARRARRTPLFGAITTVGAGIGLSLMFSLMGLKFLVGVGALVFCVGLAQLIALRIEARRATA